MANKFEISSIKSKLGWSNAFSRDAAFPLDVYQWFGSYEEAEAAAKQAVEFGSTDSPYYLGMQVYVFDGETCKTYLIQGDKSLKEIGAGGSGTTHVVETKEELTQIEEAKVGEQAFVKTGEDAGIYILTALPASSLENWSKVNSDVTWASGDKINFSATTYSAFKALGQKDTNTLYVITDIGKIYKGSADVTSGIKLVETEETIPEATEAVPGVVYVAEDTFAIKILNTETQELVTLSPGYVTDGSHWAEVTDNSKLVTLKVVKDKLAEEIEKATTGSTISTITNTFTDGNIKTTIHQGEQDIESAEVELTGVAHTPEYSNSKLTINVFGQEPVEVDFTEMLKDKFLKSAEYEASYDPEQHNNVNPELSGKAVIIFTIDGETDPLVVDVSKLVDTYESGSVDGDTITVQVKGNKISATLNISGSADGSIVTTDSDGKLVAKTVDVVVGDVITQAISQALSEGEIKTALDKKLDKLSGGNADEIITSTADGSVQRSGKKIGGTTLAEDSDENTVATEAAVADLMTWKAIE